MKTKKFIFLFTLVILFSFPACRQMQQKTEIRKIVAEWIGKEILFPVDFQCSVLGKDTTLNVCSNLLDAEYKIFLYADSNGCTICKIQLMDWQRLMSKADSMGNVRFKINTK